MVLQNLLYPYIWQQNALNTGIQGASLRIFTFFHFSCLFGIQIGILMAVLC